MEGEKERLAAVRLLVGERERGRGGLWPGEPYDIRQMVLVRLRR